jgi:hypothetical protein
MYQQPRLFVLVDAGNENAIYAVGVDLGDEAVTFRRDPQSSRSQFGRHESPQSAHAIFNRLHCLELQWPDKETLLNDPA